MAELIKVGELCEISSSKRIFAKEYQESGIPFFRGKEVTEKYNGKLNVTTELFISEEKYLELVSKFGVPQQGDMLLTSVGTLGSTYIVKGSDKFYFQDGNLTWIKNFKGLNSQSFQYWLESPEGKGQLRKSEIGSSQSAYTIANLKEMQISLPSIDDQLHAVSYIEKYDNLIENNNRRIAILEDVAQSLYREWFVNFRYPNHQDDLDADGKPKLVDTPLGQIPEGWEVKRLDEVADINPQSITQRNAPEKIGYIDISSVGTGVIDEVKPMLFNEAPSRARRVVVDGDIIWATVRPNRKQYSFICKPLPNTIVSTGFAVIRSKSLPESYLYSFTTTDSFTGYLINHATGSAYPAVNSDIFQKAGILVPPKNLVEKFDEFCSRAISLSEVLKKKNANLKQQRDMLLPKLISGQIELKD